MKGMGLFSKQKNRESFSTMNPETDVIINIQTTCTRDEAVAKLLGWSRGRYFPRSVQVTKHGIDVVDLGMVSHFEGSVQEQLAVIYEKARSEFIDAAENGVSYETLKALEDKVNECRALVDKAADYFLDLDDELSAPEILRIDRMKSERDGQIHITLRSLAQWSKEKYKIDITQVAATEDDPSDSTSEPDAYSGDGKGLTDTDKIYLAFAALIDVAAENIKYKKKEGDPNILQIAKAMETHMKSQLPNSRGTGHETFRKRLDEAQASVVKHRRLLGNKF